MEGAVYLPDAVADEIERAQAADRVKWLWADIAGRLIAQPGIPLSIHSKIVSHIVRAENYSQYLWLYRRLRKIGFLSRDNSYLPKSVDPDRARCKSFIFNHNRKTENILGGAWRWVSVGHLSSLSSAAFAWFRSVWCVGIASGSRLVALVWDSLRRLGLSVGDWLAPLLARRITSDCGGRLYHGVSNLRKVLRRQLFLSGCRPVLVDSHATHVAIAVGLFADDPSERTELVGMLEGGNFYREFADLAGLDAADVKKEFQRQVIYTWKPHNPFWNAFQTRYPKMASRLALARDWGPIIKKTKSIDRNGRRCVICTRLGQRVLSRKLSRIESDIFLRDAMTKLDGKIVLGPPFHDCLMVQPQDAETAKRFIQDAFIRRLGFSPFIKIEVFNEA